MPMTPTPSPDNNLEVNIQGVILNGRPIVMVTLRYDRGVTVTFSLDSTDVPQFANEMKKCGRSAIQTWHEIQNQNPELN